MCGVGTFAVEWVRHPAAAGWVPAVLPVADGAGVHRNGGLRAGHAFPGVANDRVPVVRLRTVRLDPPAGRPVRGYAAWPAGVAAACQAHWTGGRGRGEILPAHGDRVGLPA